MHRRHPPAPVGEAGVRRPVAHEIAGDPQSLEGGEQRPRLILDGGLDGTPFRSIRWCQLLRDLRGRSRHGLRQRHRIHERDLTDRVAHAMHGASCRQERTEPRIVGRLQHITIGRDRRRCAPLGTVRGGAEVPQSARELGQAAGAVHYRQRERPQGVVARQFQHIVIAQIHRHPLRTDAESLDAVQRQAPRGRLRPLQHQGVMIEREDPRRIDVATAHDAHHAHRKRGGGRRHARIASTTASVSCSVGNTAVGACEASSGTV